MIKTEINDTEVTNALLDLKSKLADMRPVFEVLGDLLEDTTEKRFATGTAPDGTAWAPKSPVTIKAYEDRGLSVSSKPLWGPNLDTIPLRQSFFSQATSDTLEMGTNKVQAAVMQFGAAQGASGKSARGTPLPWGTIPARPFIGISEEDRGLIAITIEEWLEEP